MTPHIFHKKTKIWQIPYIVREHSFYVHESSTTITRSGLKKPLNDEMLNFNLE